MYMLDNKIIYNKDLQNNTIPVKIENSDISLIDGLTLESTNTKSGKTFLNINGCGVDAGNIKNITVPSNGQWTAYTVK